MRRHTVIGERILRAVPALRTAAPLVRWSHERWDGAGYPDGLEGDEIPLGASIIAAFDAMTEDRPYQAARPPPGRGSPSCGGAAGPQFDPRVAGELAVLIEERLVRANVAPAPRVTAEPA